MPHTLSWERCWGCFGVSVESLSEVLQGVIAPNTFRRILKKYDLLSENHTQNKRRLAFSKRHANEAWQVDTLFGPFVKKANGKSTQTKLIAFIDDASRVLCHGEFFFTEDIEALKATLRTALYKRGIPQCIYADNGSIYKAKNLSVICARLGTQLRHTPVRDGAPFKQLGPLALCLAQSALGRRTLQPSQTHNPSNETH